MGATQTWARLYTPHKGAQPFDDFANRICLPAFRVWANNDPLEVIGYHPRHRQRQRQELDGAGGSLAVAVLLR